MRTAGQVNFVRCCGVRSRQKDQDSWRILQRAIARCKIRAGAGRRNRCT